MPKRYLKSSYFPNPSAKIAIIRLEKAIADAILFSKIPDEEYLANI